MNIQEIMNKHNEAMRLVQDAIVFRATGDESSCHEFYKQAFELESQVALEYLNIGKEPMRSIFFRSAATMALNADLYRSAERMVSFGLIGDPPADIAQELRDLMDDIKFHRSLQEKGKQIGYNALQLSIDGSGVGYGWIESGEFIRRFQAITNLVHRSAQRLAKRPMLGRKVPDEIINQYSPYLGASSKGSFNIEIKFIKGDVNQTSLFDAEQLVFMDLIENLDLLNQGKTEDLKYKLSNDEYYLNFVQLTKVLAPDGDIVKTVSLSTTSNQNEKSVFLRKKSSEYPTFKQISKSEKVRKGKTITAIGIIRVADSESNKIKIIDEKDGKKSKFEITISSGLSDIVRLYFDTRIKATLRSIGRDKYELEDLEKAD